MKLAYQATHLMSVICLSIKISLDQWFSKCGQDLPAASASPGIFLEMQVLTLTYRPTKSDNLTKGVPDNLFSQSLQVIMMHNEVWESLVCKDVMIWPSKMNIPVLVHLICLEIDSLI